MKKLMTRLDYNEYTDYIFRGNPYFGDNDDCSNDYI